MQNFYSMVNDNLDINLFVTYAYDKFVTGAVEFLATDIDQTDECIEISDDNDHFVRIPLSATCVFDPAGIWKFDLNGMSIAVSSKDFAKLS